MPKDPESKDSPIIPPDPSEAIETGYLSELTGQVEIFEDSALPIMATKLSSVESMLSLLTRNVKFSDFTREILLSIMKAVKCEAGSILEVDHKNNTLFFRSLVGQSSERIARFVIPMGKGIVGYVAESQQPLVVANVKENEVHLKAVQHTAGFEARNIVALPIIIRSKVYGVLELINRVGEADFTKEDVELLTYMCANAGRAIEIRLMLAWAQQPKREVA